MALYITSSFLMDVEVNPGILLLKANYDFYFACIHIFCALVRAHWKNTFLRIRFACFILRGSDLDPFHLLEV